MSGGSGSGPLVPTFHGFVHNSMDGLVLFEACLSGKLHHVPRRPHDRERTSLIKSGSIFIYEENASGIKRWTDGVAWSPSRILGNFLIYRELEKPFPPGEKKRAMKRKRSQAEGQGRRGSEEDSEPAPEVNMPPTPPSPKPAPPEQNGDSATNETERELDRQLIGSLVDSYGFRPDGLVKKTMSISINGVSHHLVSYYKVEDVKSNILRRPMEDPRLANTQVRPELYMKQNFRTPVEDSEHYMMNNQDYHSQSNPYGGMMGGGYGMRPGPYAMPSPNYPPSMYGTPASSGGMYSPATAAPGWSSAPQHPGMSAGYSSTAYGSQPYSDYYARTSSSTPQSSMVKTEDPGHNSSSYSHLGASTSSYAGSSSSRPPAPGYPSMQSQYHSPMRPTSASYPPTTSVQHSASTVAGGPGSQAYGASAGPSTQSYGAPSATHAAPQSASYSSAAPPMSYSREGATHAGAGQELRSPQAPSGPASAGTASHSSLGAPMQYRPSAYPPQDGTSQNETGSLSMGSSYATPSHGGAPQYHSSGYTGYGTPAQSYRAPIDSSAAVSNPSQYQ